MITDALQIHITFQIQLTMYLSVKNFYCKKELINLSTVTFYNKLLFKLSFVLWSKVQYLTPYCL